MTEERKVNLVRVGECECVCVCVCEREREKVGVWVCERESV